MTECCPKKETKEKSLDSSILRDKYLIYTYMLIELGNSEFTRFPIILNYYFFRWLRDAYIIFNEDGNYRIPEISFYFLMFFFLLTVMDSPLFSHALYHINATDDETEHSHVTLNNLVCCT